jgi:hypothetical protein
MKRISIGLAALAAFVSFSGVGLLARAEQPVRCEVTQAGKKEVKNAATAKACEKMGGKVVAEKETPKPKAEAPKTEAPKKTN